jgi:hypothetical protein
MNKYLLFLYFINVIQHLNCQLTSFVNKDSKLVGFAEKQWFRDLLLRFRIRILRMSIITDGSVIKGI